MAKDPHKNLKDAAEAYAITAHLSGGTGKSAEMAERSLRNAEAAAERAEQGKK
jgi:hypothetical protein